MAGRRDLESGKLRARTKNGRLTTLQPIPGRMTSFAAGIILQQFDYWAIIALNTRSEDPLSDLPEIFKSLSIELNKANRIRGSNPFSWIKCFCIIKVGF